MATIAEQLTSLNNGIAAAKEEVNGQADLIDQLKQLLAGNVIETNLPNAYQVASIDELPTNAVDGSMAIVESDSIKGEWEWKDNTNPLDYSMLNLPNTDYNVVVEIDGQEPMTSLFSEFRFCRYEGAFETYIGIYLLIDTDGEFDDNFTTFSLYTDVYNIYATKVDGTENGNRYFTEDDFRNFIKTNCNRLSGGYSLYTRENGKWVYKCEIA